MLSVFLSYKSKVKIKKNQRLAIIDRDQIFKECLSFSKKDLIVDFFGELGMDAGAVKIEMFPSFFKAELKKMFESISESGYIPKNSMIIFLYKLLGLATTNCFLQNGPPF